MRDPLACSVFHIHMILEHTSVCVWKLHSIFFLGVTGPEKKANETFVLTIFFWPLIGCHFQIHLFVCSFVVRKSFSFFFSFFISKIRPKTCYYNWSIISEMNGIAFLTWFFFLLLKIEDEWLSKSGSTNGSFFSDR